MPCDLTKRSRRCSGSHCSECPDIRAKHLHRTKRGETTLEFDHCESHACPAVNVHCMNPKQPDKPYCDTHLCRKPRCGTQAVSPHGNCEFHVVCAKDTCGNARAEKTEGGYENHCYQHLRGKCSSCDEEVPRNDAYCQSHACGFRECREPKEESDGSQKQFCKTHSCRWAKCRNSISSLRSPDSKYCHTHECTKADCHNKAKTSGGLCKQVHACWKSGCTKGRAGAPKYCTNHECVEQECHEQALKVGGYCQAYHDCAEDDCPRRRATGRYCSNHECKEMGCDKNAKAGEEFCRQHACQQGGCLDRRSVDPPDTSYCATHKCKELGCSRQARDPEGYCEQFHACGIPDCLGKSSGSSADAKFCTIHECKHDECWAESRDPGGYCVTQHACQRHKCKELRGDSTCNGLCDGHRREELMEKEEELDRVKMEFEEVKRQKKTTAKPPPPQEAQNQQPNSTDQKHGLPADVKIPRDSVDDLRSQLAGLQDPRNPRAAEAEDLLQQVAHLFLNFVKPKRIFHHSGSENRVGSTPLGPTRLERSVSWAAPSFGRRFSRS